MGEELSKTPRERNASRADHEPDNHHASASLLLEESEGASSDTVSFSTPIMPMKRQEKQTVVLYIDGQNIIHTAKKESGAVASSVNAATAPAALRRGYFTPCPSLRRRDRGSFLGRCAITAGLCTMAAGEASRAA